MAPVEAETDAVRAAAMQLASLDPGFPAASGTAPCVILRGGPYPGDRLPGECETLSERQAGAWIVTFTERWNRSVASSGWHSWTFRVGSGGRAEWSGEAGDIAPQLYR